jgi:hypothetical protein
MDLEALRAGAFYTNSSEDGSAHNLRRQSPFRAGSFEQPSSGKRVSSIPKPRLTATEHAADPAGQAFPCAGPDRCARSKRIAQTRPVPLRSGCRHHQDRPAGVRRHRQMLRYASTFRASARENHRAPPVSRASNSVACDGNSPFAVNSSIGEMRFGWETRRRAGLYERTAKKGRKKGKEKRKSKKKYKSTLDKKMRFTRYSSRASNCLPSVRTFRRSSPIRTPEKNVSEEYRCRHK